MTASPAEHDLAAMPVLVMGVAIQRSATCIGGAGQARSAGFARVEGMPRTRPTSLLRARGVSAKR